MLVGKFGSLDTAFTYLDSAGHGEAFASVSWHTGMLILRIAPRLGAREKKNAEGEWSCVLRCLSFGLLKTRARSGAVFLVFVFGLGGPIMRTPLKWLVEMNPHILSPKGPR